MHKIHTLIVLVLMIFMVSCSPNFEWGHHFSFTNNTGIFIDSLDIQVGDSINRIVANCTVAQIDSCSLEDNISVPNKNYPHPVKITIYSENHQYQIKADSFDCYNCDGDHEYIITKEKASYKFHN